MKPRAQWTQLKLRAVKEERVEAKIDPLMSDIFPRRGGGQGRLLLD